MKNSNLTDKNETVNKSVLTSSSPKDSVPYERVNDLGLAILYHSQSVFYIVQDGKFQSFSPHLLKSTGFSYEELQKINSLDLVHPEDREMVRENAIKMLKGERSAPYEFRLLNKDKKIKYVRETVTSITYAGNRATLGNWVNLTEYRQVESDLNISEENYRNFFDNLNDAAILADTETGIIVEANKQASNLLGRSHDEIVGLHQSQIHPPDQVEKFKELFRKHSSQSIFFNEDGIIINKYGDLIPVTISTSFSEMHGKRYILCIFHDTSNRKRAELALKESEELFSKAFNAIPETLTIARFRDGALIVVNDNYCSHSGLDRSAIIGRTAVELGLWDQFNKHDLVMEELQNKNSMGNMEIAIKTKSGETNTVLISAEKFNINGETCVLTLGKDITERKRAEEALKESEEEFRNIIEHGNDSILFLQNGKIIYSNSKISEMFGYAMKEVKGKSFLDFIAPEDKKKAWESYTRRIRGDKVPEKYELTLLAKDGRKVNVEISASLFTYHGDIANMAIIRDITERKQAIEVLQESEAKFKNLAEQSPNMIFINQNGHIVYANKKCEDVIGYTKEALYSPDFNFLTLIAPKYRGVIEKNFKRHMENAENPPTEYSIVTKAGKEIECILNTKLISYNDGTAILGTATDINERKRVEEALRESEEKLTTVFQTSPDCIALVKVGDNKFIDVNDAFVKLNGYSREEVIGHTATEVNIWANTDERDRILKIMKETGSVHNEKCNLRSKTGEIRIGLFSAKVVIIRGEPYSIAVTIDITEQTRVEQALKESEEKFSVTFRSSPEMIAVTNLKTGKYIEVNDSFISVTGYSREELVGHDLGEINMFVDPHDAEKMANIVQEKGGIKNLEFSFRMKSGEIRVWLCSSESTVINGDPCSIAVATDITERKKIEDELHKYKEYLEELVSLRTQELENSNSKLEQELTERRRIEEELQDAIKRADAANKAKSEFLARMSHEIRTPIHGVMGTLDLLCDTKLELEQQQYVNMSKTSAENLLNVINDILDFSKIEAGKLEIDYKEFELNGMLEDTLEAIAVSAHRKGLEIILQISRDVPSNLLGDATRLRQIIINLLGNAVKFTEQGEILLRVENESNNENEVELHFSVKDTGIGIPKEKGEILFQPFEQVDGSNQRKYGGTGLGLSISKQLVSLMGGRIWFKSWEREGSVFHFTAKFKKQASSKPIENTQGIPMELRGTSLMLIDDNATYRSILKDVLTDWGFRVTEMNSGHAAIKELEDGTGTSRKYRIILLDKEMPEMNGLDTAKRIIQNIRQDTSIVMMLPSDNISSDFTACQELGISNLIVKPIKKSELIVTILKALGQETKGQKSGGKVASADSLTNIMPRKILVAEDNPTSQLIAKKILEKVGHTVQIAGTGIEVIRMLKEGKFDIILMDVEMPEMSGIEATRLIRKEENISKQHIPIVAMTAYAMKEDRQKCLDAGMDTYISKPVNIDELQKIIKEFSSTNDNLSPVVDIEAAYKFVGGHKEILEEVVHVFLDEDYLEQLQKLKEGIAKPDAEAVKQAAHSIKGAVRSLGGKTPGDTAFKLEEMGRNNNLAGAEQILEQLKREISQFSDFYKKFDWGK